jgi:hypothetical protein
MIGSWFRRWVRGGSIPAFGSLLLMKWNLPIIALLSVALNVSVLAQTTKHRAELVRKFQACTQASRPPTLDCSGDFIANVTHLYDQGDRSVLTPLLDAGLSSDGALSQSLGWFYSNVLTRNPRTFLAGIRSRPVKQKRQLCWMAGAVDGSGMEPAMLNSVRRSLRVISSRRNDQLSSVARVCWANVNRANASTGH